MPARAQKAYFGALLGGEKPLTQRTAGRLCRLAAEIDALEPWKLLQEDHLILVQRRKDREPDFLSVLGALGEFRAVNLYPGLAGYAWFMEVAESEDPKLRRLLLTECEARQIAFPGADDLTDFDLELMRNCRFPPVRRAFQFRSVRRGYLPWYITEDEGRHLADCLEGALEAVLSQLDEQDLDILWPDTRPTYPLLCKLGGAWRLTTVELNVSIVNPPRLWAPESRIAKLPKGPNRGTLCMGDHVLPGCVGIENERPMLMHAVAVLDNSSGYAFPPRFREPGEPLAAAAADVFVNAIEARGMPPETVLVPEPAYEDALKALAATLHFRIKVRKSLPVMEDFFLSLEKFMEREGARGGGGLVQ